MSVAPGVVLVIRPDVGAVTLAQVYGLFSIVSGTLPLELFGRQGYGAMVGWGSAARQFAAAFAPFGLSAMLAGIGVQPSLLVLALLAMFGVAAFASIALLQRQSLTPLRE